MYSLDSALAKSFASGGRWASVDISGLTFAQLFSQYTRVLAILTNPFIDGKVCLDLANIQMKVGDSNVTFADFLTTNGNNTLPTTTTIPVLNPQYVKYKDAFRAGYKVSPAGPTQAPDAQLPISEKTHLYLSKPNVDFRNFLKYCLVSVNGFIHRVDADQNGAWVIDGTKSLWKSNCNQIGILNFQKVTSFSIVPVTPSMLYKTDTNQLYRNRMYVNLGQDISQKSVMLVLGGYLHVLDEKTFWRVSNTSIAIDFNNLPLFDRYHESLPYLDYSSMPFDTTPRNPTQINVDNFMQDANLIAYMQLSQTFFVIGDNPEIFKDYQQVETLPAPGILVSYVKAEFPLINGIGKVADYWATYEDKQWALTVQDNRWHRRVYDTFNPQEIQGISDNRRSTDPVRFSRARFLKIGTDLPVM